MLSEAIQKVDFKENGEKDTDWMAGIGSEVALYKEKFANNPEGCSVIVTPATPITNTIYKGKHSPVSQNLNKLTQNPPNNMKTSQTLPSIQNMMQENNAKPTTSPNSDNFGQRKSNKLPELGKSGKQEMLYECTECTEMEVCVTDRKTDLPQCSQIEKQVRFSVTTYKTPPNSPKPPCMTNLKPNYNSMSAKNGSAGMPDNIELNLLERLERLPESKA